MAGARRPSLTKLLGPHGPLAGPIAGFVHRPQQLALAEAIGESLDRGKPCLAEAGTGVGKTLAYLVPLLHWLDATGSRAVVSTHTLTLQAQLIERDIPNVLAALPRLAIHAAVLKGRSNFLCLQDLEIASGEIWTAADPQFALLRRWSDETETGDVAELDFAYPGWSEVAANADTCRQRDCRHYNRCFYFRARRNAEECNLLVVNHALFFADLRLRRANPGGPSLLPPYDAVVFDEAHHVDDIATRAFGLEWGSRRVPQLVHRAKRVPGIEPSLLGAVEAIHQRLLDPFLAADRSEGFLHELLPTEADRHDFRDRRDELSAALDLLARRLTQAADDAATPAEKDRSAGLARLASRHATELRAFVPDDPQDDATPEHFHWYQTRRLRGGMTFATLTRTPYAVAESLIESLYLRTARTTFVSATLAAEGDFGYLKERLGLDDPGASLPPPREELQDSPFDFPNRCLLYVPRHLGAPDASDAYAQTALEEIVRLIDAARGRTFVLFTSYRMLQAARERLTGALSFPLFIQNDQPNARLVEAFASAGNGVLLGTSSFWEGVDVPGPALSLVILDKIPFATPDSPPQRARENRIKATGGDAFAQWSLPQAMLRMKQGFGRLLRTANDRGVVAILDQRLWTKGYGRRMLADLPRCPRTHELARVVAFFDESPPRDHPAEGAS